MATITINTPLNVPINFELAGLDKRLGAWIIDFIVRIISFFILFNISKSLFLNKAYWDDGYEERLLALFVFSMLPAMFYYLLFEVFGNGQSLGKKALQIRVVSLEGYKPNMTQYLIRWVMRIVDVSVISLLFMGKLGLVTAWYGWGFGILAIVSFIYTVRSKKQQRLGDLAAGTAMIKLKPNLVLSDTIFEETYGNYQVTYPNVLKLSDRDITIIKKAITSYERSNNDTSLWLIAEKLENILNIKTDSDPYNLLKTIMRDYNHLSTS